MGAKVSKDPAMVGRHEGRGMIMKVEGQCGPHADREEAHLPGPPDAEAAVWSQRPRACVARTPTERITHRGTQVFCHPP
jgi:hypothetical protein